MKYFIDTEFLEGTQDKTILGIKYGKTKPTIGLISIALVSEDNREYYAVSKDFNLKEAWNRWQQRTGEGDRNNIEPKYYWIRENILKPIYNELVLHHTSVDWYYKNPHLGEKVNNGRWLEFNYESLKWLINKYGKFNKQIAEEIKEFVYEKEDILYNHPSCKVENVGEVRSKIEFYGYYCDYDWVAFCWLFGKMIDLPKGFPMYCIDLKQEFDNKVTSWRNNRISNETKDINFASWDIYAKALRNDPNYPKQTNEHNALADAKWNKQLYEFLKNL